MSIVEANISINIPDGVDPQEYINLIRNILRQTTNQESDINIVEVDNPLSTNILSPK